MLPRLVTPKLVVSCRLTYSALGVDSGGGVGVEADHTYLERARALTKRAEALGATLAAWSATTLAFGWDLESAEEAIDFATSLREEAPSPEHAWTCGIAEGEMEPLSPGGGRAELAWGPALVIAIALARAARPGEVLVDGEVHVLKTGALGTLGARFATDAGRRLRGWRLDVAHPWRTPQASPRDTSPDSGSYSDEDVTLQKQTMSAASAARLLASLDFEARLDAELARGVESIADAATIATRRVDTLAPIAPAADSGPPTSSSPSPSMPTIVSPPPVPVPAEENQHIDLREQLRKLAAGEDGGEAIRALRDERAKLEGAPAAARCQASLVLGVGLALGGHPEEALLEGLDALARAREVADPKRLDACLRFLAKLYAGVDRPEDASRLRGSTG